MSELRREGGGKMAEKNLEKKQHIDFDLLFESLQNEEIGKFREEFLLRYARRDIHPADFNRCHTSCGISSANHAPAKGRSCCCIYD